MVQGFDPVAATAAYLSVLTPDQHLKAQHYTYGRHWLLLWSCLMGIAISWIVLRTGVLVKVRDAIERRRPRPWLVVVALVVVDAVYEYVLSLPWSAYAGWWREKQYGLTSQAFAGWLTERGIGLAVGIVTSLILFSLLYWVIRRAPKTWWAWSAGGVIVAYMALMLVRPLVIEPLFNTYKPAPAGPMRNEIVAMAKQVGVPSDKILIYNGSKQSNRYTANVAGLLGTARIAMSDVMFKKDADLAEVRGVVGHEMGHYVRGHILIYAILYGGFALAVFFLTDRLFPRVAALLGAKGVRGISDPAGLPILGVIFAVLALIATPLTGAVSRIGEADADRFSLEHFNEPDGLAKALVKTVEYRAATPSRLEEIIFYDHPAVGNRVRRAMDWKAAHPKTGRVE
jgi:STE24 endopeptidase